MASKPGFKLQDHPLLIIIAALGSIAGICTCFFEGYPFFTGKPSIFSLSTATRTATQAGQSLATLTHSTATIEPSLIHPATAIMTAVPTDILAPTETFTPTSTITPSPTDTKSPIGLVKGDSLSDSRVTLKLKDVQYNQGYDRVGSRVAPISYYFDFTNHSGDALLLQFNGDNFMTTDNTGTKAQCAFVVVIVADASVNIQLNNGETKQIVARCGLGRVPASVTTYTLAVTSLSSLPNSTWVQEIPR